MLFATKRYVPLKLKEKIYDYNYKTRNTVKTKCWAVKGKQKNILNVLSMDMIDDSH